MYFELCVMFLFLGSAIIRFLQYNVSVSMHTKNNSFFLFNMSHQGTISHSGSVLSQKRNMTPSDCPLPFIIYSSFFPSSRHFVLMVRGKHVFLKDHHSLSLFYYPTHLWQWSISSYQPTPHSSSFQKIAGLIALVLFQVCLFISVCLTAYAVNFKLVVWKPNDCNPVSLTKATFCLHY